MAYYTKAKKEEVKNLWYKYDFGRGDTKIIIELAKIFKVDVDESRLDDYRITNLEYSNSGIFTPSITIYDLKNKIQVTSKITSVPSIGNVYPANDDEYFEKRISSNKGFLTKAYYTWEDEDKPIVEQLEFNLDENSIVFVREDWKQIYRNPDYDRELIICYYGKDKHAELFFNKYLDYEDSCYHYFEQKACQEVRAFKNNYDCPDNYIYCDDNNLIYAIKSQYNTIGCTANGIFIEKNKKISENGNYLRKVFPITIGYENFPNVKLPEVESFMVYLPHDKEKKEQTHFEIYKTNEMIAINCKYLLWDDNKGWIVNQEENLKLPIMNIGPITGDEIRRITNNLPQIKDDDNIRKMLCNDLLTYADMLDDRDKSLTKYDMLSSKKLINTPFEQILEEVGNNKDKYFDIADKQFREMAYSEIKKPVVKVLKHNNN